MAYIVSARKYRPKTFDEVVGQQAVTHILKKAIEQKRLPQALLFTGPRGVGKTSCARIMAREVNKAFLDDPDQDLSFNIFELDAASNNSVDDIRELINQVNIPPQVGKYKVYIIDEVHMLSNQAFNAFLKTLEEPPEHAIFILATTEKHKILPTILSRCQVFDFRRISVKDIQAHLRKIADAEGVDIEDEALYLIAKKADGALRDALSAFDKIINIGEGKITRKMVSDYLGILDRDVFEQMYRLFVEGDSAGVLRMYNGLVEQGTDIYHFVGGLASYMRDVLVATDNRSIDVLDYPEEAKNALRQAAAKTDPAMLLKAIERITQADLDYKMSQNPLLLVELALLRVTDWLGGDKKKTIDRPVSTAATAEKPESGEAPSRQATREISTEKPAGTPPSQESAATVKTPEKPESPSPEEPPAAEEKPSVEPPSEKPGKGLLGLKTLRQKKAQKDGKEPQRQSFTREDFLRHKDAFLQYLAERGRKRDYVLLKHTEFDTEGETIRLTMDSALSRKAFMEFSQEFLRYLKNKLHNDFIRFDIVIVERPKEKKVLYYTDTEKIDRLTELNPHMKDLIHLFKLRQG